MIPAYLKDPPAWFHTRVLVGAGAMLTPRFATNRGITHVINCAFEQDSPEWFRTAYPDKYACMNAYDTYEHKILDWYPKFEETMKRFLREGDGVVYVHCLAGMNRSGFLALTYICKNFGMNFDASIFVLKRQRPCLFQNLVYMNQVKDFIYGRVQSQEDSGVAGVGNSSGNAGLGASGNGNKPAGIQNTPGVSARGTRLHSSADFRFIFQK